MHDASRCAMPMCMCALRMRMGQVEVVINNLVRRTMVESNLKASIIHTWLVKTLHNVLSSFTLSRSLLPSCTCTLTSLLSLSQRHQLTIGCVQHSTPQHVHCGGPAMLFSLSSIVKKRRSSMLPCPLVSILCPAHARLIVSARDA